MRIENCFKALLSVAACAAALSPPALAGADAAAADAMAGEARSAGEDDVLVFQPIFFADYNPQTAADMVARVPGFSISNGGGGRGLAGGLGNVLIDGRRPSSKNGVSALLSRLPSDTVERIELIRAPIPGVDMAGQDQVVNVLTNRTGGWSGAWRGRSALFEGGRLVPSGEVSATRASAQTTLTLGLDLSAHANGNDQERIVRRVDFSPLTAERERSQNRFDDLTASVAYAREFDAGHALRVDARGWVWGSGFNRHGGVRTIAGAPLNAAFGSGDTAATGGEATVDFDYALPGAWSLKLTALQRLTEKSGEDVYDDFAPDGRLAGRLTLVDAETAGESILRLETRKSEGQVHATTLSLEGAYNFLEGAFDLFDGEDLIPINVPVSDTKVEEHRVDVSAQRIWRPHPAWTFEGVLGMELSRLTQSGDAQKERSFVFFKPELTASWTPNARDQLRLSARRFVGQLSFGDFISSINVNDDTSQQGNPDLEPERTWRLQADWERRFAEEGSLTLIARHEWVEAVSGLVPLAGRFDAPGNLCDGRRWRLQADAATPLEALGIQGAVLSGSAMVRETRVNDPVTGLERRFRGDEDWRASVDFRQDLPGAGFAWGFDYSVQGAEDFYRLDQFERITPARGDLDLFAETRRLAGLTARVGADLNLGRQERTRYVFSGPRDTGDILEIETRTVDYDGQVYFELSGVF
ncbi:TonB-dependent receptor plug domain-containing protein [Maricaulaceae bacterium MS644]